MSQQTKVLLSIIVLSIAILAGAIFFLSKNSTPTPSSQSIADPKILVRENSHKIASDSAKVTLVEFGDYQCPACGVIYPIVKEVVKEYEGKINFVFRNFPLSQHKNSQMAAEVAEAAGAQSKFWQMYDLLYKGQADWGENAKPIEFFMLYAKNLGLDEKKFNDDISNNKFSDVINQDQNDGLSLGVNSTPTFFLDGQKLEEVPSLSQFKSLIDTKLNN